MLFLIDENTTSSIRIVFEESGFEAECVKDIKELHGQSDEVVFDYAVDKQAVIEVVLMSVEEWIVRTREEPMDSGSVAATLYAIPYLLRRGLITAQTLM